jgi:restriction system protein
MAEVTMARTGSHIHRLFGILSKYPGGLQAGQAMKALTAASQLTPYEQGSFASGGGRFEKIVRFATVDCVKAGWLLKNKGVWSLTDAGRLAMVDFPNPEALYREAVRLYRDWKRKETPPEIVGSLEELSPADTATAEARVTFEQAEEQAWSEIEAHILSMPPYDFQDLVAELLKALGYFIEWVSPPGKDGGVDIIAHTDPLGTKLPRIKVQVKRVSNRVDLQTLNSFLAVVETGDVGLYVSTGGFTRDAEDAARKQSGRKITLINLDRLVELWIEAYAKIDEKARRRLPLSPIYFLTPED